MELSLRVPGLPAALRERRTPDQMGEVKGKWARAAPQLGPGKVRDRWTGSGGERENKVFPPAEGSCFLGGELRGWSLCRGGGCHRRPHTNAKKGEAGALPYRVPMSPGRSDLGWL